MQETLKAQKIVVLSRTIEYEEFDLQSSESHYVEVEDISSENSMRNALARLYYRKYSSGPVSHLKPENRKKLKRFVNSIVRDWQRGIRDKRKERGIREFKNPELNFVDAVKVNGKIYIDIDCCNYLARDTPALIF